jgi:transposase
VQVVIALIVTPDGFPLAYEVMDGNTSDKTTLKELLAKITAVRLRARLVLERADLAGACGRKWVVSI